MKPWRIRKRVIPWFVLGLVVFGLQAERAVAGLTDEVAATFRRLARELEAAFPPVEGVVVAVEGGRLYLDLGEATGAYPGMELSVFRRGEVFRHPLTGQPLGQHEETLGFAQISQVRDRYSVARFIPLDGPREVRVEDQVRITRGRIRVAVLPLIDLTRSELSAQRVGYLLASILERTGRFLPVDPQKVQDLLATERVSALELYTTPALARRLGRTLGVSGFIAPVLVEVGGSRALDAAWLSAITGTPLFSRRHGLMPTPGEAERRFPWEPPPAE